VLSEEGVDDPARLGADRVWIVDPLDGTREFAEPGRSDWAVHVALWQAATTYPDAGSPDAGSEPGAYRVGELVAAAVALPALGVTLSTAGPLPTPLPAGELPRPLRVIASRSRAPAVVGQVAEALGATVVSLGSAGAKVSAVIRGEDEIYVHAGGQYEWDSAAPVAVALRAGLHASRLDGSVLTYNHADPLLPDLVVCHPSLAEAVLAVTRGA
nr:inositol monophosphatase family protein [Micromonospora sp. DSM 115978]